MRRVRPRAALALLGCLAVTACKPGNAGTGVPAAAPEPAPETYRPGEAPKPPFTLAAPPAPPVFTGHIKDIRGTDGTLVLTVGEGKEARDQAFQITEDLLDVEGDAGRTGKRVQKDAVRGKLTYPGFLGVADSRRRAARLGQEAHAHLSPLGPRGQRLAALVRYVLERDR